MEALPNVGDGDDEHEEDRVPLLLSLELGKLSELSSKRTNVKNDHL